MELSLDSTQNHQKKVPAKTLISLPAQEATNSSKPQPSYEELEEEEQEDQFDLTVGITDPEKIGKYLGFLVMLGCGYGKHS